VGLGGVAGESLVSQVGIVEELAGRLDDVDALPPIAPGELTAPDRCVQRAGEINPGQLAFTVVGIEARGEQVAHPKVGAGAMVEGRAGVDGVGHLGDVPNLTYRYDMAGHDDMAGDDLTWFPDPSILRDLQPGLPTFAKLRHDTYHAERRGGGRRDYA